MSEFFSNLLAQSSTGIPGWANLIVCDGTGTDPCTFEDLIELVKALITNLVLVSTLLVVCALIYAGFKLMTSGGNTNALDEAKNTFMSIIKGYLWILAAWLIVYTITSLLLDDGYSLLGAPK